MRDERTKREKESYAKEERGEGTRQTAIELDYEEFRAGGGRDGELSADDAFQAKTSNERANRSRAAA